MKNKGSRRELMFRKNKSNVAGYRKKVHVEHIPSFPDHAYDLEESERLKRSQAVRALVEKEAVKNYPAPAIVNAVKEYATKKLDFSISVKELKWREVANIKYKVRGPQNTHFVGASNLTQDIRDAVSFLEKEGYLFESFRIQHQSTCGFVFIHPKQLEKL